MRDQTIHITITGLPGSGKSTVAFAIARMLRSEGLIVINEDDAADAPNAEFAAALTRPKNIPSKQIVINSIAISRDPIAALPETPVAAKKAPKAPKVAAVKTVSKPIIPKTDATRSVKKLVKMTASKPKKIIATNT